MKFLPLLWSNLLRRKVRTVFTLLSILVAFMLLGTLLAIRVAFSGGVTVAGAERLMMLDKVSLINSLPISYLARIRTASGVADVTHANWFGGVYQDPKNAFANLAVEPESWLRVHPELVMPAGQEKTWLADRTGALVGVETARRFGWKIGDRVPLQGTIYRRPDGRPWELTIDAIYDAAENTDKTQLFLHYAYLNETIPKGAYGNDEVSWYVIRVADPRQAELVARRLDALFANSSSETKTATEKVFVSSFASQIGDIGTIMIGIAGAVLFTILLVTGNTMAQAIRERTSELAILKTLGFSEAKIVGLVLAESCLIALVGGAAGLGLSWTAITLIGDPTHGMLPPIYLPARDLAFAAGLIAALGLATGILPALQARRLKIVDALRRH
ncbi:MAG: yknZ 1 [Acidobacteria bacterium]|nr:yknZ 1 [Acidobacteriota bacterium]